MSENVQFDMDSQNAKYKPGAVVGQPEARGMTAWLLKKGIIKDQSQAGGVFVGILIINIILISLILYFYVL